MKALLMDVCLILLILAGTAGADAPAYLANAVEAASGGTDLPKYTPIPASRKTPAKNSSEEATPQPSDLRSVIVPAGTTSKPSAKLVAAPIPGEAPNYESAPAPSIAQAPSSIAPVASPPGEVAEWDVNVSPTPAPVLPPATIETTPEPGYAYQPLVPVVATPKTIHLGRGIFGQPTVYVPGQPVRNFLRYFSP